MRRLPIRKCYHIAKLGVICLIVITIVTLFEHWRGGKRSARAAYLNSVDDDFERQIQEDEARIRPGLGEGGIASHLDGEEKRLGEETVKKLAVNVYLSDLIPYNRTLKDYRNPACERVVYDAELPSASVILIFHNEPYSVVVRTIWSVVNSARRDQSWYKHANFVDREGKRMNLGYPGQDPSSPFVYLKEIVLVDDNSTLPELKGKLSHYIRTRLPPDLIKILRLPDRQGLMKARMRGARSARGDVLIFLDAHCEAAADWLRPLLQRIKHKRDAVVTPLIDVVDQDTFQLDAAEYFQVGGFTFNGHFTWIEIPEREKKRRGSNIAPTWSPTMAGGLFAMKRDYYWELGAYDEQMAGWGGENLEMSFRIWQCGGTLETVPCSRVGHVFRSFHPYGLPANSDTHGINTARMAEVWMDDYKELFYLHRPDLRKSPKIGDVTHRKILREKLKCKSFQWYLDNIYKEKFVPVRDVYGFGRFSNPASGLCLDTLQREGEASPLGVYPCHGSLMATQYLSLSLSGQLRDEEKCAELEYRRSSEVDDDGRKVLMVSCRNKMRGQRWRVLPDGQIQHMASQLCLDAGTEPGADVLATRCRRAAPAQRWNIDYSESNDFKLASNIEPSEQEMKLRALRKKSRRISRSLLSVDNNDIDTDDANNTTVLRSHKHKKRRRSKKHKSKKHGKSVKRTKMKNKFILKILRTLMNDTEEHLEVDVYCKHHQLFPNNTFVRDLVTILNANNIKVINNGRVFERNKVTDIQASDAIKENEKKVVDKIHVEEFQQNDITTARNLDKSTKKRRKKPLPLSEVNEETAPLDAAQSDKKKIIIEDNTLLDTASDNKKIIIEDKSPLDAAVSDNKKIIIEDFVAIKPVDATTEANKRRRRKRKRTRARPAPPPTAALRDGDGDSGGDRDGDRGREEHYVIKIGDQESEEDTAKAPPPKSVSIEDTPMALSQEATPVKDRSEKDNAAERDDGDNELWSIGESRFRGNKSLATRRRSTRPIVEPDVDTQQQPLESVRLMSTASPGRGPPVKVVMRSNLTFNLGDDFFAWRRHNLDDAVADVLEELIIPTNLSSALRPRTLPRTLPRPRALPRASRRPSTRSDSDQSSSSSESASGDT